MKILNILFIFLLFPLFLQAQYRELNPDSIVVLDFNEKEAKAYEQKVKRAEKLDARMEAG